MGERETLRIGKWLFEPSLNRISDGDERSTLEPLAASVLEYLAQRPREVVSADELIEHLWGRRYVGDSPVYRIIAELRRELKDDARQPQYIETIRKRGYRMVAPVEFVEPGRHEPQAHELPSDSGRPRIRLWLWSAAVAIVLAAGTFLLQRQPPPAATPVVAVMPFENLSPGAEDYLVRGLTDSVATRLANVSGVLVISQNSARQYADSDKPSQVIGAELGATHLVTGTALQRDDDQRAIRVNAHLVDIATDSYVWSQTYEQPLADIIDLQTDIAERVAQQLDLNVLEPGRSERLQLATDGIQSYDHYLRGRDYLERGWQEEDLRQAAVQFETAIERDPGYAPAYAGLGLAHLQLYAQYWDRSTDRLERARAMIDAALELEPDLVEAQFALGSYYLRRNMFEAAEQHLDIVRGRQPSHTDALAALAQVHQHLGNFDEAAIYFDDAVQLDPLNHRLLYLQGLTHVVAGNYQRAESSLERSIVLRPDLLEGYIYKALLYMSWRGDERAAAEELERAADRLGLEFVVEFLLQPGLSGTFRFAGPVYREALLEFDPEGTSADPAAWHLALAELEELRGETDAARDHYAAAVELLEQTVAEVPDEPFFHALLGSAYAGAGQRTLALETGRELLTMAPVEESVWDNADFLWYMAEIYLQLGMFDEASDQVALALDYPTTLSRAWIAVEPFWDPIREHPRFREVMDERQSRR